MTKPLNVLLLMGDQHTAAWTGCYGHRSVKTPTLDALAARAAVFDAAYCPSPISAPSRAAMMCGAHVHKCEVWDNAAPLNSDWPTFAHSFAAAGYRTILCGKMHFVGPDQLHGFTERWVDDIYPADFRWTRSHRDGPPVNPGQNIDHVYRAGPGWNPDMEYDEQVAWRSEYGLRHELAREKRPWLLCVSLTNPHHPYKAPQKYWDLYRDQDVDLPELPADFQKRDHEYVKWLRHHGRMENPAPMENVRDARHGYLARCTMLDDYLARVLAAAGQGGLLDNTLVVYTSDHGDMLGEHGLWFKNAAFEYSARVPLLIAGPGLKPRRVREVVSLLDLGPTFCGLTGVKPVFQAPDGRDLTDLMQERRAEEPGQAIMENYGEGVWRGWRMIRRGDYKLNWVPGCPPELFDLKRDPGEWNNLADDPACRAIREDLTQHVLKSWDPDECNQRRWQSEDRRLSIIKSWHASGCGPDWQRSSTPLPHPLNYGSYRADIG